MVMWPFRPNIERLYHKRDIRGLCQALRHEDASIRVAAARAMGEMRQDITGLAVDAILDALSDKVLEVRQAATASIESLYETVPQRFDNVRVEMISELAKAGSTGVAILARIKGFCGSEREVPAIRALGLTSDRSAVDPLLKVLANPWGNPSDNPKASAREALCHLGEDQLAQAFADALEENSQKLVQLKDARAFEPMIAALRRSAIGHPPKARAAAKALMALDSKMAVETLLDALKNAESHSWGELAAALGLLGTPALERLLQLLETSSTQAEPSCPLTAVSDALGRLGDLAVPPLSDFLASQAARPRVLERSPWEKAALAAIEALGLTGSETAVEPLARMAGRRDGIGYLRRAAITSLGQLKNAAINALVSLLKDEQPWIRHEAKEELERIGGQRAEQELRKHEAREALLKVLPQGKDQDIAEAAKLLEEDQGFFLPILLATERMLSSFEELRPDGVTFRANWALLDDKRLAPLLDALRQSYELWKRHTAENLIQWWTGIFSFEDRGEKYYFEKARAVGMLTVLHDFSMLPELQAERNGLDPRAAAEDTSHGGTTLWQTYGGFINAVDFMIMLSGRKRITQI